MLAQQPSIAQRVVIADPAVLQQRANQLGLPLTLHPYNSQQRAQAQSTGELSIVPIPTATAVTSGQLDTRNANYVLQTLARACDGCHTGEFAAVVTGPVQKSVINDAGIAFSGHTEFFAERTGGHTPVMMLTCPGLRVALVTTHLPLRAVADAITSHTVTTIIQILYRDLQQKFGLQNPKILVCGLNPHAGEGGHLGDEEHTIIEPALAALRQTGMNLHGPLPADTLFTPKYLNGADAVLAMYHDQGLPVLKHLGFGHAVNVTLGLPIIRTSVDHGTALDLAGTGQAQVGSLQAAVELAAELSQTQLGQQPPSHTSP